MNKVVEVNMLLCIIMPNDVSGRPNKKLWFSVFNQFEGSRLILNKFYTVPLSVREIHAILGKSAIRHSRQHTFEPFFFKRDANRKTQTQ